MRILSVWKGSSDRDRALLGCGAVILLGFFLHIWHLPQTPSGLLWDEGASGLDLVPLFQGQAPIFFPGHSGHPPIFFYLAAGALKVFGWTPFSLRLPAVFLNTLALPATFVLARRLFGMRVALLSSALMCASLWTITYSRLGAVHSTLPLFLAIAGYWLVVWLHGGRAWWLPILAGACLGLVFYTYAPGWFMAFVALVAWLWTFVCSPKRRTALLRQGVIFAGAAGIVFAPLASYLLSHGSEATQRTSEVSIFNPAYHGAFGAWLSSVKATALMFSFAGEPGWDKNIAHRPLFDPVLSVFFVIGLLIAIRNIRKPGYLLAIAWLVIMALPLTLTAKDLPDFGRMVGIAPILFIFPALPIAWLWEFRSRYRGIIGLSYLALVALNSWLYFGVWAGSPERIQVYRPAILAASQSAVSALTSGAAPQRVYFGMLEPFDAVSDFIVAGFQIQHPSLADGLVGYDARFTRILPPAGSASYLIASGRPAVTSLPPVRFHASFTFEDAVQVDGYDLPATAVPGQPLTLQVLWRPGHAPSGNLTFFAHLLDYRQQPTPVGFDQNGFPPSAWRGGETILSNFPLTVPADIQPGAYRVEWGAYDDSGRRLQEAHGDNRVLLGPVVVAPTTSSPQTIQADLGGYTGLVSSNISRAGGGADIVLTWQPEHVFEQDYSVFVHLLDSSAKLVAQADGPPAEGRWPTRYWIPGTPVMDVHHLSLAGLPPGTYSVAAGLYQLNTGARLASSKPGPEPNSILVGELSLP